MEGGQPIRIYCKGDTTLNMAVRGNELRLVRDDPNDESQHWIQDYSVGRVTDDQGRRAFALVNNLGGTRRVVLISTKNNRQLEMAPYGDCVKLSMLWSLGVQLPGGYSEVRVLSDLSKTLNGINGFVKEGTVVGIYSAEPHSIHAIWKFDPINK
uniref:Ricin B lectin domain-containing protein n=1 Tax=Oryza meridionalis TaxID=40149 RepID=A0A0E0FAB2_9ORYZ